MANDVPPPPPPAPAPPAVPKAAYVEEYNEEAETENPATRQTANISTKRSKPDVSSARVPHDGVSDSGHSSHTAGTLASSATSLESKAGSNPPKIEKNTPASKRRPTVVENITKSKSHSPEKPSIQRTQSKSKKDGHAQSKQPCNCSESVAKVRRSSTAHEPSKNLESKPKTKSRPILGGLRRSTKPPPPQTVPKPPKVEPVQARPRASTEQSYYRNARPVSFHAGAIPSQPIFVQQPYVLERQPSYPVPSPFPPPSYPPPQQTYFPRPPQPIPAPQEFYTAAPSPYAIQPRPRPRQWNSEQAPPPRPQSMYYGSPPPIVEYGEQPLYTTIAPGVRPTPLQSRQPAPVAPEEYPPHPEDYFKMPPPKIITQSQQRPPMIRHAHTTSDARPPLRQRRSGQEESIKAHVSNRSPLKQSFTDHERSKRPAPRPAKESDESAPSMRAVERGMGRMNIESSTSKNKRRASVYGHESLHDLERSVETYQAATKGPPTPSNPLPIDSLVRKKKPSSDTSSRQSGKSGKSKTSREGSDVKSRRPSSEIKSRNENDGLAMRFNASQGVNLDLKGGIEGRTISLRQSKDGGDGAMELSIGSRGRAVVASRPPIAGREKSRRRYSYIEDNNGGGVTEIERSKTISNSRPPLRRQSYLDSANGRVSEIERPKISSSSRQYPPPAPSSSSSRGYSYHDARQPGLVTEVARSTSTSTGRGYSYLDDRGVSTSQQQLQRVNSSGSGGAAVAMVSNVALERRGGREERGREEREREPRILRERIITTSRTRRSSRGAY